jgi:hypothetical protein
MELIVPEPNEPLDKPKIKGDNINWSCLSCLNPYLTRVCSSYIDGKCMRGHMFAMINDKSYHIRLNIIAGNTEIMGHNLQLTIPNLDLNPTNLIDKLKLYILFS